MHRKTRHIPLFLLAFNVLTGSVGMAATQRFCAMLGMAPTRVAAEKMEKMGGCKASKKNSVHSSQEKTTVDKTPCCKVTTTYHKLEVVPALKVSKVEFAAVTPVVGQQFIFISVVSATAASDGWPLYSNSSPPLAGKDLLHRFHILNI